MLRRRRRQIAFGREVHHSAMESATLGLRRYRKITVGVVIVAGLDSKSIAVNNENATQ